MPVVYQRSWRFAFCRRQVSDNVLRQSLRVMQRFILKFAQDEADQPWADHKFGLGRNIFQRGVVGEGFLHRGLNFP